MKKKDLKEDSASAGGLMYQQLRKLINIVVSLSRSPLIQLFLG